jgi:hypothetical protein
MKSNLSSRDWQDLSAYLDHELNPSERSNFEKRLQNEAELRATLFDLRRTRAVLRSQPPVRVPRNFTLKPEQVGLRQPSRNYPVWGLVSVLASLLFIVLLVGDLAGQRSMLSASSAQLMNSLEAQEAAPQAFESVPQEAPGSEAYPPPSAAMKSVAPSPTMEAPAQAEAPTPYGMGGLAQDSMLATQAAQSLPGPQIFGVDERLWRGFEILVLFAAIAAGLIWLINRRRI